METHLPHHEQRPWGEFLEFTRNSTTSVKIITVKANEALSLQTHQQRDEFWYVLSGTGVAQKDTDVIQIKAGDTISIPRTTPHRLSGISELKVLEISTGKFDDNDIIRLEDKYGRASRDNPAAKP